MVRSRLIAFTLVLCLVLAVPTQAQASSYSPYNDGNIGSSQLQIFRDIVYDLPIGDSYVACRTGQYTYKLFVGDLKYQSGQFLGNDTSSIVKVYTIDTNNSSYNSRYVYTVTTEQNFSLDSSNYLVYSNLGDYPLLEERSTAYAFITLLVVIVIGLCMLIRPLFAFVYRLRGNPNV